MQRLRDQLREEMSKLKDSVAQFAEAPERKLLPAAQGTRTPKGIKKMLKRLGRIWREHPDMRLGQLLTSPFATDGYLTNLRTLGDGKLLETLEEHYGD